MRCPANTDPPGVSRSSTPGGAGSASAACIAWLTLSSVMGPRSATWLVALRSKVGSIWVDRCRVVSRTPPRAHP